MAGGELGETTRRLGSFVAAWCGYVDAGVSLCYCCDGYFRCYSYYHHSNSNYHHLEEYFRELGLKFSNYRDYLSHLGKGKYGKAILPATFRTLP